MTGKLVFSADNVCFDLMSHFENSGTFSLRNYGSELYGFEWVPDASRDPKELSDNNIPSNVTIPLKEVSAIMYRDLSFKVTEFIVVYNDSMKLPKFSFRKAPSLSVKHIIEFLMHKKILESHKSQPFTYIVAQETKKAHAAPSEHINNAHLNPEMTIDIALHNKILRSLHSKTEKTLQAPLSHNECRSFIQKNDISGLKTEIFKRGVENNARPQIWLHLLGLIPYGNNFKADDASFITLQEQYQRIQDQIFLITEDQHNNSDYLQDVYRVIENDVKRNDRTTSTFSGDGNPNLGVLKNVLISYSIYNRNAGYVQGMADLVSPFIILYTNRWENNEAILFNNTITTKHGIESLVFWSFARMMKLTHHDRLFADLSTNQSFILKNSAEIAFSIHNPLKKLLSSSELDQLSFLFRPLLLLFKREFKTEDLFRLWDSIFSADFPHTFSRFLLATAILLLYPKFVIHTDGSLGSVMSVTDGFLETVNVSSLIQLTISLMNNSMKSNPSISIYIKEIPLKRDHLEFSSKYFKY